jgi:hypothetical protein
MSNVQCHLTLDIHLACSVQGQPKGRVWALLVHGICPRFFAHSSIHPLPLPWRTSPQGFSEVRVFSLFHAPERIERVRRCSSKRICGRDEIAKTIMRKRRRPAIGIF